MCLDKWCGLVELIYWGQDNLISILAFFIQNNIVKNKKTNDSFESNISC